MQLRLLQMLWTGKKKNKNNHLQGPQCLNWGLKEVQGWALRRTSGHFLLGGQPGTGRTDRMCPTPLGHVLLPSVVYLAVQAYLNGLRQEEGSTLISHTSHSRTMLACKSSVALVRAPHLFVNLTTNKKFDSRFGKAQNFKPSNPLPDDQVVNLPPCG